MSLPLLATPKRMLVATILASAALTGCGSGGTSSSLPTTAQSASSPSLSSNASVAVSRTRGVTGNLRTGATVGYSATVAADQPLAYYQLTDAGTTLTDSGPNNISGIYGSGISHQVAAITEDASSAGGFPGGSAYNANGFAFTSPNRALQPANITVEAWFQLSAANTTSHDIPIVVYGSDTKGVTYGLYIHGLGSNVNSILYTQRSTAQATPIFLYGTTRLAVGKIYHVAAVSDGNAVTIYVNGLLDRSAAYPGSIAYAAPVLNGLSIGGASQNPAYGSAPFSGTIAQVAVYGSAFTPAKVVNHFLAGQLIPMTTEQATSADTFVDSIGVNTHFENHYTQYVAQYDQVKALLLNSGIRHIRVGMVFGDPNYNRMMQDMGRWGIHGDYVTQLALTQSQITQFPASVSPSLEQFEAPNEQDDQASMPDWVGPCRAFQQNLYSWVKSSPNTARYPVLGPALTKPNSFAMLGDVSAYMDIGSMHNYFGFFNPGTAGWGSISQYGVYGSLPWDINMVKVTSGSNKPIMATETGYGTIPNDPMSLSERAHMRYMSRLFFQQFLGGVARSYSYELLDEVIPGSPFNDFGLIRSDLTPKPAYMAIKQIIGALKDPGPAFTTSPLTYQISGFINNVHHLVMQKRDGSYVLALWLEVPDWNTVNNAGGDIVVPQQAVTLSTSQTFSSANIMVMSDAGGFSGSAIPWSGQRGSFNVTDKITLVTLKP